MGTLSAAPTIETMHSELSIQTFMRILKFTMHQILYFQAQRQGVACVSLILVYSEYKNFTFISQSTVLLCCKEVHK